MNAAVELSDTYSKAQIVPIWLRISKKEIIKHSPIIASIVGIRVDSGSIHSSLTEVVKTISGDKRIINEERNVYFPTFIFQATSEPALSAPIPKDEFDKLRMAFYLYDGLNDKERIVIDKICQRLRNDLCQETLELLYDVCLNLGHPFSVGTDARSVLFGFGIPAVPYILSLIINAEIPALFSSLAELFYIKSQGDEQSLTFFAELIRDKRWPDAKKRMEEVYRMLDNNEIDYESGISHNGHGDEDILYYLRGFFMHA